MRELVPLQVEHKQWMNFELIHKYSDPHREGQRGVHSCAISVTRSEMTNGLHQ